MNTEGMVMSDPVPSSSIMPEPAMLFTTTDAAAPAIWASLTFWTKVQDPRSAIITKGPVTLIFGYGAQPS